MPVESSYADYYLSVHRFATIFLLVQFLPVNRLRFRCGICHPVRNPGFYVAFLPGCLLRWKILKPRQGSPVLSPSPPPLEPPAGIFVKRQFQYRFLESHAKRGNNLDQERVRSLISISFFFFHSALYILILFFFLTLRKGLFS